MGSIAARALGGPGVALPTVGGTGRDTLRVLLAEQENGAVLCKQQALLDFCCLAPRIPSASSWGLPGAAAACSRLSGVDGMQRWAPTSSLVRGWGPPEQTSTLAGAASRPLPFTVLLFNFWQAAAAQGGGGCLT